MGRPAAPGRAAPKTAAGKPKRRPPGGLALKLWRENGPDWLPARLRPYWKRVCETVGWRNLKYRIDDDVLHLVCAALHDSEQGLDKEVSDAALVNARGRARAEYETRLKALRELVTVRANAAPPKTPKRKGGIEDYV